MPSNFKACRCRPRRRRRPRARARRFACPTARELPSSRTDFRGRSSGRLSPSAPAGVCSRHLRGSAARVNGTGPRNFTSWRRAPFRLFARMRLGILSASTTTTVPGTSGRAPDCIGRRPFGRFFCFFVHQDCPRRHGCGAPASRATKGASHVCVSRRGASRSGRHRRGGRRHGDGRRELASDAMTARSFRARGSPRDRGAT